MKKNYMKRVINHHQKLKMIFSCGALALALFSTGGHLKAQTTYTFNSCAATGMNGPSQPQVNSSYLATNLNGSVTSIAGIQAFTVPASGSYSVTLKGAQGAAGGGNGALISGTMNLVQNQVLHIVVGQQGLSYGGGGGSFLYNNTTSILLMAAAGGGGGANLVGTQGQTVTAANDGYATGVYSGTFSGKGGINGGGGGAGSASDNSISGGNGGNATDGSNTNGSSSNPGAGGAGFLGNGGNGSGAQVTGGKKWIVGMVGGNIQSQGGFGGGGGGYSGYGGGGGYSGGGGGAWTSNWSTAYGGGGGSLNTGGSQTNIVGNNPGNGIVILTLMCIPGTAPTNTTQVANQNICINNTTTLTVTGTGTLNWYATPSSTVVLGTGSVYVTPTLAVGNYTYYAASTNTCAEGPRTPITVTVNPTPTIAIAGGTAAVCPGTPINLAASGANTYSWNTGAVTSTIAPTPTANVTYTVVGTTSAGCSANAVKSVTVTPAPSLSVTGGGTICAGGQSATLSVSGADSYSWSTGSTSANIVVTPTATSTYTANGTSSVTGCSAMITVVVTVDPCAGLNNITGLNNNLNVYPNPNSGEFTVELNNGLNKTIEVSDLTGRIVLSNTTSKDKINVNINSLSNGIYYVKIQSEKTVSVIKVIKQ